VAPLGGLCCALLARQASAEDGGSADASLSLARDGAGGVGGALLLASKVDGLASSFFYRLPSLVTRLTPYAGIGLRIYFLESVVRGTAGGQSFQDTPERSTKLGFGVPLGAEFQIGPGGLFGELYPQWAPLKHATTGNSHLGGMSLFVGYRAAL